MLLSLIGMACSPYKGPVDKSISTSYYYSKKKGMICYSWMGNWFELGSIHFKADIESFEVLAEYYAKDKNHSYYKSENIDHEVDHASFRADYLFCYDKNNVYVPLKYVSDNYLDEAEKGHFLKPIKGANPTTFEDMDDGWSKDDKYIFYRYNPTELDRNSFEIINKAFVKDKDKVFALEFDKMIPTNIDVLSVKKLNERYVFDSENVYDYQEYIDGEKVGSLLTIPYSNPKNIYIKEEKYLFVEERVFYDDTELVGVHSATFKIDTKDNMYALDKNKVYYFGEEIAQADPKSFTILDYWIYAKDSKRVFYEGKEIKGADVETFGPVENDKTSFPMHKDKNHIYKNGEVFTE
ncbi:hypothetical protein NH26_03145 [Flammeovirga pacifica]|uniref:DKNYY family protein n=2 Tax=Flammeovirga pacifica TaxID=915059 RepID=A0A1S1YWN3_FLAPC|nr:hypothetical protein NH26_03145 [Flammeovirga pacifica]